MGSQSEWPPLRAGTHLSADDGACLMEWVSLTAGETWRDDPPCTHPLLAHVARRVNDAMSDRRRSALTVFIPALIGAHHEGAWVYAAVAAACTRTALEWHPSALVRLLDGAAVRRADPGDTRRHRLYVHGAAYRSVDLAVSAVQRLPEERADEALRNMLRSAIDVVCGHPLAPRSHRRSTRVASPW